MNDNQTIIQLRSKTGAGIVDCKNALLESGGDINKATEILRAKGQKVVAAKMAREAREGLIHSYLHPNGRVGVLIEVNCETDFVSRNEEFRNLVHDLALQVASMNPLYIEPQNIPEEVLSKEKKIYEEELEKENKPSEIKEKIIEGKMQKYYEEICFMKQFFIKDDKVKIEELIAQKIRVLGENIQVRRFIRYSL